MCANLAAPNRCSKSERQCRSRVGAAVQIVAERGLRCETAVTDLRANRRRDMRKTLLTTVAAAAVVGFTAWRRRKPRKNGPRKQAREAGGGAAQWKHRRPAPAPWAAPSKAKSTVKTPAKSSTSARTERQAGPATRSGPEKRDNAATRRTEGVNPARRSSVAPRTRSAAQQQRGAQEENTKSGVNADEQHRQQEPRAQAAAPVQLVADAAQQRSRPSSAGVSGARDDECELRRFGRRESTARRACRGSARGRRGNRSAISKASITSWSAITS